MDLDRSKTPNAAQYFWLANALLLLTFYGSVIPLRYQPMSLDQAVERFRKISVYDPELTEARGDWAVNLVQYAAVGFCYVAALGVDRRLALSVLAAAVVVPAGCAVATAIEFLQIYFPPRTVSVNDILVESAGVVLGSAAWLLAGQRFTDWFRRFWGGKGLAALAGQALPAYLAVLLTTLLMPFDVVIGREEIAEKYRQGRILLVPFAGLASGDLAGWLHLLKNVAGFLPVGALLALTPRWSGRGWRTILAVGFGISVVFESLKLVVFTRDCDATDIVTGTAAILLGWQLVRVLRDRLSAERRGLGGVHEAWEAHRLRAAHWGAGPWLLFALAWAVILVLAYWQPYHFTTDPARFSQSDADLSDEQTSVFWLRRMSWAPLVDYYWGSRYQALDQILVRSLSFAPLGAFLGLAFLSRRRTGAAVTLVAALGLSGVIEVGKYFVPERHPSVTDLLINAFGAGLGYVLARHAAHALAPAAGVRFMGASQAPSRAALAALRSGAPWGPALSAAHRTYRPVAQPPTGFVKSFLERFDAVPYWLCLLLVFAASVLIPLGLVLLLSVLRVL